MTLSSEVISLFHINTPSCYEKLFNTLKVDTDAVAGDRPKVGISELHVIRVVTERINHCGMDKLYEPTIAILRI